MLGRVVGGADPRDQPGHARRVDDVAFALRGQHRQEGPYPVDDSPQVDSQHPLPRRERAEPRVRKTGHARVIADHVHRSEAINRGSCQSIDRRLVADIGGHRKSFAAQARDLF